MTIEYPTAKATNNSMIVNIEIPEEVLGGGRCPARSARAVGDNSAGFFFLLGTFFRRGACLRRLGDPADCGFIRHMGQW